jgi:hypothetical protein
LLASTAQHFLGIAFSHGRSSDEEATGFPRGHAASPVSVSFSLSSLFDAACV